jgi:hypothetical protein
MPPALQTATTVALLCTLWLATPGTVALRQYDGGGHAARLKARKRLTFLHDHMRMMAERGQHPPPAAPATLAKRLNAWLRWLRLQWMTG